MNESKLWKNWAIWWNEINFNGAREDSGIPLVCLLFSWGGLWAAEQPMAPPKRENKKSKPNGRIEGRSTQQMNEFMNEWSCVVSGLFSSLLLWWVKGAERHWLRRRRENAKRRTAQMTQSIQSTNFSFLSLWRKEGKEKLIVDCPLFPFFEWRPR